MGSQKNVQGRIVQNVGLGQFADLREGGLAKKRVMHFILLAPTRLSFLRTSVTDLSTNKYIHNMQFKHLHGTYIYEKQQIKLFSSNSLLIDKLN